MPRAAKPQLPKVEVPETQGKAIIEELDKRVAQLRDMLTSRDLWTERQRQAEGRMKDKRAWTAQQPSVVEGKNAETRAAILAGLLSLDESYQQDSIAAEQARVEIMEREINITILKELISTRKLEARLLIATLEFATI